MKSKVYFSKDNIGKIFKSMMRDFDGKTGIKVHFGEKGNKTFIGPEFSKIVYNLAKKKENDVSLIECNVLYRGSRTKASDHIKTAHEHGFNFAPIDILDGENGDKSWKIKIKGKHFNEIYVGAGLKSYKNIITVSHFKGHSGNGFGGTLKNIGMGLGSRQGKMAMHAAFELTINHEKCIGCGICAKKCDAHAITINNKKAEIDFKKCLRCAGCIVNCPQEAIEIPWGASSSEDLQESIVEYCAGILQELNLISCFNILNNITSDCDCYGEPMQKIAPDIGILGSTDPVALDQASYDLFVKTAGEDLFRKLHSIDSNRQLEHAEKLGLGSRAYNLIEI